MRGAALETWERRSGARGSRLRGEGARTAETVRRAFASSSPLRSLHLAGTTRRPIRTPAFRVGVGDRLLDQRRLLVQHGLDRLVLQDDPNKRVYEGVVELVALGAESDGQRD